MILRAAALAGVLLVGAGGGALAADPSFLGDWARGDGKTHIRIEPCGGVFSGFNTWVRSGVTGEKIGDRLTINVRPAGAERWSGDAFDPQRNQTYTIKIHVTNEGMTTYGCLSSGMFCASLNWTRLDLSK